MQFNLMDVIPSGDGRCDSPDKSAKFCTCSMMETEHNQVLHFDKR